MNKLFLIFLCLVSIKAFALDVILNHKLFFIDSNNAYVEIHTNIPAINTLQQLNYVLKPSKDGKGLEARFLITQTLIQNGEVVDVNKIELSSGLIKDSTISDVFNIQRFQFKPGEYLLEVKVQDLNAEGNAIAQNYFPISAPFKSALFASDIVFLQDIKETKKVNNLSKNGYDMFPLMDNYFPSEYDKLLYYIEFYNTAKSFDNGVFVLKTEILNNKKEALTTYQKFKRQNVKEVNVIIDAIDIKSLESGTYQLVLSLINAENKTLWTKNYSFFRNNVKEVLPPENLSEEMMDLAFPVLFRDYDTLSLFTFLLSPRANMYEKEQIKELTKRQHLKAKDNFYDLKKFFYLFWYNRNPSSPSYQWSLYKQELDEVDELFGTITFHGARTDRGRVYLEYGPPNDIITRNHDSNSYPYSIWYYHRIRNFNNQKFLFYDPELSNERFVLLHSTMQGELKNRKWEDYLKIRKTPSFDNIDENNSGTQSLTNDRARELWERAGGY